MSAGLLKIHLIGEQDRTGENIRTVCGREATMAPGFPPSPGHPGEYDTAICDRIEATDHLPDVTCKRCCPAEVRP